VRAKVREGSPGGRIEATGGRICKTGRFYAGSEGERELWMSRVLNNKRKKWWVKKLMVNRKKTRDRTLTKQREFFMLWDWSWQPGSGFSILAFHYLAMLVCTCACCQPMWSCDLLVGTRFLCSVLVAPVRNESSEIILFIVNLEDITDAPLKHDSYRGSLRHSMLRFAIIFYCRLPTHRPQLVVK